ncbi:hypothetical protein [Capnocytophaga stomatis]|uniref:hypothetical protein n=1 Tax=Capnocytophaga stomatis TaxID=1848904 RepID=UPI0012FFC147|nr:hypothetical protein [Capnocytophaga stomatis]
MDFNLFNSWLINTYGFDALENDFFEKALANAYREFSLLTDANEFTPALFADFLQTYTSYLRLLLPLIPLPLSSQAVNIEGICLNDFSHCKNELQQKILLLDAQL